MWKLLTASLCLMLVSLASSRLVCYYNSMAETREEPGKFKVSDIDPHKCTHLIYAFSDINSQHQLVPTTADDIQRYKVFNGLKNKNPYLKTLLAVGGSTFYTLKFSVAVESPQNRAKFIQSAITLLRLFGFDGLNLDWRYPGGAGGQPQDKHRFTLLCKELKMAFEAEGRATGQDSLLITATVSAERATIDTSYEVEQIAMYLDFINVMTYDLHGSWSGVTRHHSPLYQGSQDTGDNIYSNIHSAMKYWHEMGAPAHKLNVGFGAYGRVYNLASSSSHVGAPANGPGDKEGLWSYYQTCHYLKEVTASMIPDQQVPYATKGHLWVGFDNQESRQSKVSYLQTNKYGGAFVWSLDLDDFRGQFCNEGNYPFISHLHTLMVRDLSGVKMATTSPTTTTSDPEGLRICAGKSDGNYGNPKNPNSFYSCVNKSPIPRKCQSGLIFIEQLNRCERINTTPKLSTAISLVNTSPTTEKTTTSSKTATPTISTSPTGPGFCAGKSEGNYAHPTNSNYFYSCVNQASVLRICPSGLIFIKKLNLCDWPPQTTAPTSPTGLEKTNFCAGKSDGNYANPKNSNTFYSCANKSPTFRKCQSGLIFNEQLNRCDWPPTALTTHSDTTNTSPTALTTHSDTTNTSPTALTTHSDTTNTSPTALTTHSDTTNTSPTTTISPTTSTPTNPPNPQSPHLCEGKRNGNYAHPSNPNSYYSCVNQIYYLRHCPQSLIFIEHLKLCDWPPTTTASSTSTSASTTMMMPSTTTISGNPCGNKIGLIPDDNDPHHYFSCDGVKALHKSCPNDQVFDQSCKCCENSAA